MDAWYERNYLERILKKVLVGTLLVELEDGKRKGWRLAEGWNFKENLIN